MQPSTNQPFQAADKITERDVVQGIRIVVTGDYQHAEHRALFSSPALEADLAICQMDWRELLDQESVAADLIVVAQSRRGQFGQESIRRLADRFPLAARVVVFGSWCEGETRSGQPLQAIHRVYRRDWVNVCHRFCHEMATQGTSSLHLPPAFGLIDQWLARPPLTEPVPRLNLVVHSFDPEFPQVIADFCRQRAWSSASLDASPKCDVGVCECYYSIDEVPDFARALFQKFGTVPVIAICGFPREQDRQRLARSVGRSLILGKPFDNQDFHSAVLRLVQNGELNVVGHVA